VGYLFTGNGGTDDVGVVDVHGSSLAVQDAEVHRIPVQTGPFAWRSARMASTWRAPTGRASGRGSRGTHLDHDVKKAIAKDKNAEVARVLVGTNDPGVKTRPFAGSLHPRREANPVSNFRSNNLSVVDVERAIKGEPAEVARIP